MNIKYIYGNFLLVLSTVPFAGTKSLFGGTLPVLAEHCQYYPDYCTTTLLSLPKRILPSICVVFAVFFKNISVDTTPFQTKTQGFSAFVKPQNRLASYLHTATAYSFGEIV